MEENKELIFSKEANKNKYLLSLVIGAILFLLLSVVYVFGSRLALRIKYQDLTNEEILETEAYYALLSITQLLYQVPLIFFFIFMFRDDLVNDFKILNKSKLKNLAFIVGGSVLCFVLPLIVSSIYEAFGITDTSNNQETIDTALSSSGWVFMAISVVIGAPFVEEMLFRKSFCDTMKYRFHVNDIITIVLSTLLFSFMHVTDAESLIFIFQYIPLALVIVLSYYFSKTIYVPIIIHFINNLISVIVTFLAIYGVLG